ncbi:uncharacterized protein LOC115713275 [Cannabis sativa]|uniref:uncharacterized protein LOC115713275 n=1 Tax=Cannabis sativa TaxID=3483 RepID=UPI0029C9FCE1|nr:uncharacterized protein LOC115713275 [Cannabis sativa]
MLSPQGGGAREDELFTKEKMDLIPKSLKWMVVEFLNLKDKRDIITIPVPREFIVLCTQITLSREDLQQVATCDFIGNQGMLFGMMHIWESLNGMRNFFKFYDPELLVVNGITEEEKSQSFDNAARRLAAWLSLMNNNHQMFFIPWKIWCALDARGRYAKENYPFRPCMWPPNSRRNYSNDRKGTHMSILARGKEFH